MTHRRLIAAITIALAVLGWTTAAQAACTSQTILGPNGTMTICTTCCAGAHCTTTCF